MRRRGLREMPRGATSVAAAMPPRTAPLPCRPAHPPAQGIEERLGGPLGMLRCWARCLLAAGAKSYTHMVTALERYYGPLKNAVDAAGAEVRARGVGCWRERQTGCSVASRLLLWPPRHGLTAACLPPPSSLPIPSVQGETALVATASRVWRRAPQRAAMAVDRLMTLRLVSADAIVE